MCCVMANVSLAADNDPVSTNPWFTSLPPADMSEVSSATLVKFDGYLKRNQSVYFNIYVDFDAGGTTFWIINENGTLTQCTFNVNCTSSILKMSTYGFTACTITNLLSPSSALHSSLGGVIVNTRLYGLLTQSCSDSTTCEGKSAGRLLQGAGISNADAGQCRHSFGNRGDSLGMKSPIYVQFLNAGAGPLAGFPEILADFTIGIKMTGASGPNGE
jgi:hypothetical protein